MDTIPRPSTFLLISLCQFSYERAAETPLYSFNVSENFGPFISPHLKTLNTAEFHLTMANIVLGDVAYGWNFFWSRSFCRCTLRNSVGYSVDATRSFCVSWWIIIYNPNLLKSIHNKNIYCIFYWVKFANLRLRAKTTHLSHKL